MTEKIQILEKPESVSWDEIHNVLWRAHEQNRQKGIMMLLPALSAKELQKYVGDGKMFVAMDDNRVIGTIAIIIKEGKLWYNKGRYGYLCLGAVLPDYSGKGVFRLLYDHAEKEARRLNLSVLTRDTNEKNSRMLKISKKEGYHFVAYRACRDHFNIVRAKWLNGCPNPLWYIKLRFQISKIYLKTRFKMVPGKGRTKRFGI